VILSIVERFGEGGEGLCTALPFNGTRITVPARITASCKSGTLKSSSKVSALGYPACPFLTYLNAKRCFRRETAMNRDESIARLTLDFLRNHLEDDRKTISDYDHSREMNNLIHVERIMLQLKSSSSMNEVTNLGCSFRILKRVVVYIQGEEFTDSLSLLPPFLSRTSQSKRCIMDHECFRIVTFSRKCISRRYP
jgi:hypothetical protein